MCRVNDEARGTVESGGDSKQGREAESQKWSWVEAEVWTERMLTPLETGVQGGKWFSLIDKVYRNRSLEAAWRRYVDGKEPVEWMAKVSRSLSGDGKGNWSNCTRN